MSGPQSVSVDRTLCASTGVCESYAPEVFEIGDDGELRVLQDPVEPAQEHAVRSAAQACPTRALRWPARST